MGWWTEICPPGGILSIKFGGPTGIYSLVVLMTWWCMLLKTKPDKERTNCLRMLTDIDRVFLEAIKEIKASSTSMSLSPTTPPPSTQPRKRGISEEMLPCKHGRSEQI